MVIDNAFNLWDIVYLKTDTTQVQRMVTGINIRGELLYELSHGTTASWHREKEISAEVDILIKVE